MNDVNTSAVANAARFEHAEPGPHRSSANAIAGWLGGILTMVVCLAGVWEELAKMRLITMDVSATEVPDVLDAYLDRNYYTTEDVARLAASVHPGASKARTDGLRLSVSLIDEGGEVISTHELRVATADATTPVTEELPPNAYVSLVRAREESQIELPIRELPPGRHRVRLRLGRWLWRACDRAEPAFAQTSPCRGRDDGGQSRSGEPDTAGGWEAILPGGDGELGDG